MGGQRKRRTGRRRWIVLLTLFGATATAAAAESPRAWFDIPEGPAEDTLSIFAAQSGLQVLFGYDDVRGIGTHAVSGWLHADAALRAMTLGTRLKLRFMDQDAVTFTVLPPSRQPRAPSLGTPETETESARGADVSPIPHVTVLGTMSSPERAPGGEIITLSRLDIERTGWATLPEAIRTLPQVFGGGPTEDTQIGREAAGNSARGSGVNVRGLDAGSALVLIDGDRLAAGGADGAFVDISNIPLLGIQEIRLMPAGASLRYGADAVGGVVNLVTRDANVGNETTVRQGGATAGGYAETQVGQWLARSWNTGHAQGGLEYTAHGALPASNSRQTQSDLTALGGSDWDTTSANPGTLFAGGRSWRIPKGQDGTALSAADLVPGQNHANRLEGADVLAGQERLSFFGSAHQHLSPAFELIGHLLASEREMRGRSAPVTAVLTVPPTNPDYVNPSGLPGPVQVGYSFGPDLGPISVAARVSTVNTALEAEGLAGSWRLSGGTSYGSERQRQHTDNLIDTAALLAALNDPDPATAFNAFADGSHTNPLTIAKIRTNAEFHTASESLSVNGVAERRVGIVELALGGEHLEQTFRSELLAHGASPNLERDLTRHVDALYAEVMLPLLKHTADRVGAPHAEMYLGAREDRFSDFGAGVAPQIGLDFSPIPTWNFRANWRRAMRPPTLTDLVESNNIAVILPQADPNHPQAVIPALIWSGNNANLRPEHARSWSVGADIVPSAMPTMSLAVTYYGVNFTDRVADAGFTTSILTDPSYAGRVTLDPSPAQRAAVCEAVTFIGTPGGCLSAPVRALIDLRRRNLAALKTSGIDVLSRYRWLSSLGTLDLGLNANYVLSYAVAPTEGSEFQELVNTPSHPLHFRLRTSATWEHRAWSSSLFLNYTNRHPDPHSTPPRDVASWVTVDVTGEYRLGAVKRGPQGRTALAIALRNLFDRAPPFLNNPIGIGYDQENADPLGRTVSVSIRQSW